MDQTTQNSMFGLTLSYTSGNNLKEASKWARFISILLIIVLSLLILIMGLAAAFLAGNVGATALGANALIAGLGSLAILLFVLYMIAYLVSAIQLLRFSFRVRDAIDSQDQQLFNSSLKSFKNYFIITGILSILGVLYSVLIVGFMLFGFSRPSSMF